jgi:hypothetical protein
VESTWHFLIINQRAKLSTWSITHHCLGNWRIFRRKKATAGSPRRFVLARQCSCSPVTCNPEQTALSLIQMSWSPTIFSRSDTVGLPSAPWTEKIIDRSTFFPQAEVISTAQSRLEGNNTDFLSGLQSYRIGVEVLWTSWGVCCLNTDFGSFSFCPSRSG